MLPKTQKEKETQKDDYIWLIPVIAIGAIFLIAFIVILIMYFRYRRSIKGTNPEVFSSKVAESYQRFLENPLEFNGYGRDGFSFKKEKPMRISKEEESKNASKEAFLLAERRRKAQGSRY